VQSVIVHKEHHDVGGRTPDLITHAPAVNRHKHGGVNPLDWAAQLMPGGPVH